MLRRMQLVCSLILFSLTAQAQEMGVQTGTRPAFREPPESLTQKYERIVRL
jgi:hypothetical protein